MWEDPGFSAVSSKLLSLSQRPGEHLPSPCNIHFLLRVPPQLPQHLEKSTYPGLHQVSLGVRAEGQPSSWDGDWLGGEGWKTYRG